MCATFKLKGLDGESEGMECPLGVENLFTGDENVDELAYEDDPDWNRFALGGDDELSESKMSRGRLCMGERTGRTGHLSETRTKSGSPRKFEQAAAERWRRGSLRRAQQSDRLC